jgi:hypothetical protein
MERLPSPMAAFGVIYFEATGFRTDEILEENY